MTPADELHAADFACQQGHCLSSMLWKGPACSETAYTAPAQRQTRPNEAPNTAPAVPARSQQERAEPKEAVNGNGVKFTPSDESNGSNYSQLSKDALVKAMEKTGWVQAKAARILGLTPRQIGYALKKHGIEMKRF
jgi:Nif-specific regulatory protein